MQRLSPHPVVVGLDAAAPEWLRRRIPAGETARRTLVDALAGVATERLVLHTCERLEVLGTGGSAPAAERVRLLCAWLGVAPEHVAPHLRLRHGPEAERHTLRLAAGLESRLPGEPQIQGQVRRALAEATAAGAVGPELGALVRTALHTGRRVRRETALGRAPSIVGLAVARLRLARGDLRHRRVLLAGTGALARDLATALAREGARLAVASRDPDRAAALAAEHRGVALPLHALQAAFGRGDAPLVACTDAPVSLEGVAARPAPPVLDLGSPPSVSAGPGLEVTRLAELRASVPAPALEAAARIVEAELTRYSCARAERAAAGRIAELVRRRRAVASGARPTPAERRALHLEIQRLKATAA